MAGYIKIHRKLLDWGWYSVPCVKDVFIHLLITANYAPAEFHGKTIERGQAVFSLDSLSKKLGYSIQQIRTAIGKLKQTREISVWSNRHFSVATITNYNDYQDMDEQQTNNKQITNHQQTDNKQITNNQQTNNTVIRNKEIKKGRNKSTNARACTREAVLNSFNTICKDLPKVKTLTEKRVMYIDGALDLINKYGVSLDDVFRRVHASDFLCGRGREWKASFDWVIIPGNLVKIIEGNFDNAPPKPKKGGSMFSMEGASFDLKEIEKRGMFDD